MPSATPSVIESQLRRARTDLEESLRVFVDKRAETLLVEYPAVAADTEAALELVYTEFVVREELGQNPHAEDWYRRFPQWRADLEQMFEVHHELKRETTQRKSRASTAHHPTLPDATSSARRIGEFEILSELGRGGMGVVYKARQPSLGRVVALKVILSGTHAGERERERFRREAETAAKLDHSNIVRIFELGEHDGRPFCAMEFVDGVPLSDRLTGSPWAPRQAAELIATIATAAQHAHENGVIHRDLKPANILLAGVKKEGSGDRTESNPSASTPPATSSPIAVKIVDFGLAKSLSDTDPGPTRTGDIIGTPTYMAPEQADAATPLIGPATDVWAMGVTLYELLVGHPPFQGASSVETLQQVRASEPISPSRLRPTLPRDLAVICLKCLRKKPSDRYPSAAALAEDLGRWLRGEAIRARPVGDLERIARWSRRNPTIAGLTAAAVVLAITAAVFAVVAVVNLDTARIQANKLVAQEREARAVQGEQRLTDLRRAVKLQLNEGIRLLNDGDFAGAAILLADAMEKDPDPGNEVLHRIRLGTTLRAMPTLHQSFRITIDKNQFRPRMPDNGRVQLAFIPGTPEPLVSQDGSTLLANPHSLSKVVWDVRTGASHSVSQPTGDVAIPIVAMSSNGRVLVGFRDKKTLAWDTTSGQPVSLPLAPESGTLPPPFTPNGSRRLAAGDKPNTLRLYAPNGEPVGAPITHDDDILCAALGAGGKLVATGSKDRTARVWDAATGEPITPPLKSELFVTMLALSPDGTMLTIKGPDGGLQTWEVKTAQPMGHRFQHGTGSLGAGILPPKYNPVRPRLATAGWCYGLRIWEAKLGRSISEPMPDTTPIVAFEFSPDGDTVAVVDQNRCTRIWEPNAATPVTPKLYAGERHLSRFTADGRLLTATTSGDVRVWEAPSLHPPGATIHQGQARAAEWLVDGRAVLSVGASGAIVSDAASGKILRSFPHSNCLSMAIQRTEPTVLATRGVNGAVLLWDFNAERPTPRQLLPHTRVQAMAFAPDGRLATGGEDGIVRFWNPMTGTPDGQTLRHGTDIDSISFTPSGERMLVSTHDKFATLWELPSGRRKRTIPQMQPGPLPVFTPDGQHLAVTSGNTTTLLSSADAATRCLTLDVGLWNERPTFSRDGRFLAMWNQGAKSVMIWDVASGKPIGSPLVYPEGRGQPSAPSLSFSADGRFLALAGGTFTLVWDVDTGTSITPPLPIPYSKTAGFSNDSHKLLIASADSTVRVIDLTPDTRPAETLAAFARLLANRTLDANGTLAPLDPEETQRLWERFKP